MILCEALFMPAAMARPSCHVLAVSGSNGRHTKNYSYSIPLSVSTSATAASAGDECSSTQLQLRGLLEHRRIKPSVSFENSISRPAVAIWNQMLPLLLIAAILAVDAATAKSEVKALENLIKSLNSPSQLTGWNASGGSPCSQLWRGIHCSKRRVTEIKLSGLGLKGTMGSQLQRLSSLKTLDLSDNNIQDSIPDQLPPRVRYLNLGGNNLSGKLPYSIATMKSLRYLDLSFNKLSQGIPPSFRSLSKLSVLHLQNNQLSGPLNVIYYLPIKDLNIENNNFTRLLPPHLSSDPRFKTGGNNLSPGPGPLPPLYQAPSAYQASSPSQKAIGGLHAQAPACPNTKIGSGGKQGLSDGAIVGIPLGSIILVLVVALAVTCYVWRSSKKSNGNTVSHDNPMSTVQMFEETTVDVESSVGNIIRSPIGVEVFSTMDLLVATNFFSQENLIREGKLGQVYRGEFPNGKIMALKKYIVGHYLPTLMKLSWKLLPIYHSYTMRTLLSLLAIPSKIGNTFLFMNTMAMEILKTSYMVVMTVARKLTWNCRVKIALGIAKALQYLHEVCMPPIAHKNFKVANVLLDDNLYPHLSDSGVATCPLRAGHQVPMHILNSFRNNAPEHAMAGMYTTKNDIYSFGVVLLDLLTGRMPFDCSKHESEQSLVKWAVPQLHDIDVLAKMVDPALKGIYMAKSVSIFMDIISMCLQPEPEFRPLMSDAVHILSCLVQRVSSGQVGAM